MTTRRRIEGGLDLVVEPVGLAVEAVGAEHLQALAPDRSGLRRGGREDQDPPVGQPVHLGEDGDVVVLQPATDDGEAASGRRWRSGHARAVSLGHDPHAAVVADHAIAVRHVEPEAASRLSGGTGFGASLGWK